MSYHSTIVSGGKDFRLAAYRRKGGPKSVPPVGKDIVNEYAVGLHRTIALVTSLERAGHQSVVAQLHLLKRTRQLTPAQAHEVRMELQWRIREVKSLTRIIENARAAVKFQARKLSAPDDLTEFQPMVVGPRVPVRPDTPRKESVMAQPHTKHTATGVVHFLARGRDKSAKGDATVVPRASWLPGVDAPQKLSGDEQ